LAALLLILSAVTLGLELFYAFRNAETSDPRIYVAIAKQVCLVGVLIIMSFLFSNVLSRCVQFGKLVWKKEQFVELTSRVRTMLDMIVN